MNLLSRSRVLSTLLESVINSETRTKHLVQYKDFDNEIIPIGDAKLIPKLLPGIYDVRETMSGIVLSKKDIRSDDILKFEDSRYNKVVEEVSKFWTLNERYSQYGLCHKRGILLYGEPGTGKSCLLKQIMDEAVSKNSVVLMSKSMYSMLSALKSIREIEKDTNILVILEDMDEYCNYEEKRILELFDGNDIVDRVLFLGTTNYINRLPPRILRPGRFDTKMEVVNPPAEGRRAYFKHKLKSESDEYISKLVDATDNFSFAELREFLVSLCCYGDTIEQTVSKVKTESKNYMGESFVESHDHNNIASNPPKFVPKHHHNIWKALVLRDKHTSYGSAVNHYKNHVFKHGTYGAEKNARLALGKPMTSESTIVRAKKLLEGNLQTDDGTPDTYTDHKDISNSIKPTIVRKKKFGDGKSALDNMAKSKKVKSRLST